MASDDRVDLETRLAQQRELRARIKSTIAAAQLDPDLEADAGAKARVDLGITEREIAKLEEQIAKLRTTA